MRTFGRRKKKLIVAFHFYFASQAAWKCDECRKQGLEKQRRCGFVGETIPAKARPVWARRNAVALSCPKSLITANSAAWLDEFFAWKVSGGSLLDLPAKTADAFMILEREWRLELQHAER